MQIDRIERLALRQSCLAEHQIVVVGYLPLVLADHN